MAYIRVLFFSALITSFVYLATALILIDIPIPAEYWVSEMITIKKALVREQTGKNKIIIAGGSSTLFGIDAKDASYQLGIPTINFGLHAGLQLDKILQEASSAAEPGDIMILPLEPPYYECPRKLSSWQIENIIGWDHQAWHQMDYVEKAEFISLISPSVFSQMIIAGIQKVFFPDRLNGRLNSLNAAFVLYKFRTRTPPSTFQYSAYHLDNHGDISNAVGAKFSGDASPFSKPDSVCPETASKLTGFVDRMKANGVRVFFANTPYIGPVEENAKINKAELGFQKEFGSIGCFIDKREYLVFDRKYFFNTSLHLNTKGRELRTNLLINAIRQNTVQGACQQY